MADNITTDDGVVATDEVASAHYQRVKLSLGADGTAADAPSGAGTESGVLRVTLPTDGTGKLATVAAVTAITNALPAGTNAIGKLAANSGVDIGDVDVTSVIPGTGATNLGKAEDAAHSTGDTGVMALGVRKDTAAQLAGTDGDYTPSIYDANGRLHVVNSAGVGGDVAHDAVESGNPISIGGIARTANPAAVSALDRVRGWFTVLGKFVVQIGAPRELITHQHTQIASSSSETTILNAGGAGVLLDLVTLIITNQTATAVNVTIKDDTAGTTRMIIALAANGGAVLSFPRPVNQAVANKPWTATLSSGSVTVNFFVQAEQNV